MANLTYSQLAKRYGKSKAGIIYYINKFTDEEKEKYIFKRKNAWCVTTAGIKRLDEIAKYDNITIIDTEPQSEQIAVEELQTDQQDDLNIKDRQILDLVADKYASKTDLLQVTNDIKIDQHDQQNAINQMQQQLNDLKQKNKHIVIVSVSALIAILVLLFLCVIWVLFN